MRWSSPTQSACAIDLDPALGAKMFSFTGAEGRDENGQTCADLIPHTATTVTLDAWVQAIDVDRYSAKLVLATGNYVGVVPPKAPEVADLLAAQPAPAQAIQGSFSIADSDSDALSRLQVLVSQISPTGPFTCALPLTTTLGSKTFSFNGSGTDLGGGRCADLLPPAGSQTNLWFLVDAVDPSGLSPLSPAVTSATYVAKPAAPLPVSDLTAQALSPTAVRLDWTASAGATEYTVYRNGGILAHIGADTSFQDVSAITGTRSCYQLKALGPGGSSALSNAACLTPPTPPIITDLTASQATQGAPITGQYTVWDADSSAMTNVRLLVGDQGATGPYACAVPGTAALGSQSYSFNGVGEDLNGLNCQALLPTNGANRTLWFKVQATDAEGWSGESVVVSTNYRSVAPPPNPPTNFLATPAGVSGGGMVLQWQRSSYATSYNIYRSNSALWPTATLYAPLGDESYFFDYFVTKGGRYCYWIKAVGDGGISEQVGPSCATAP